MPRPDAHPISVELASSKDVDHIVDLLNAVTDWLHDQGIDQWAGPAWARHDVEPAVDRATAHIVTSPAGVAGFMVVDSQADAEFWRPGDGPSDALYVHHLAVARPWAGRGIGTGLIARARALAAESDKSWLRLDAPRDNDRLREYYLARGFGHLRTVHARGRSSGALFQIPARPGS